MALSAQETLQILPMRGFRFEKKDHLFFWNDFFYVLIKFADFVYTATLLKRTIKVLNVQCTKKTSFADAILLNYFFYFFLIMADLALSNLICTLKTAIF